MNILKKAISAIRGEQFLDKLIKRGLNIGQNHTLMSGSILIHHIVGILKLVVIFGWDITLKL